MKNSTIIIQRSKILDSFIQIFTISKEAFNITAVKIDPSFLNP